MKGCWPGPSAGWKKRTFRPASGLRAPGYALSRPGQTRCRCLMLGAAPGAGIARGPIPGSPRGRSAWDGVDCPDDTGYVKHRGDRVGTARSSRRFTCSGVRSSPPGSWPPRAFPGGCPGGAEHDLLHWGGGEGRRVVVQSGLHRRMGCAIATADLLGQMAAADYPEKLSALFLEFAESAAANPPGPTTPRSRRRTTSSGRHRRSGSGTCNPGWEPISTGSLVPQRPRPDGPNEYLLRIAENVARIQGMVSSGR